MIKFEMSLQRSNNEYVQLIRISEFTKRYNISECHFQRVINETTANKIFRSLRDIIMRKEEPYIPSVITVCKTSQKYYLVDGNHRIFAYKKLLDSINYDIQFYICIVDVETEEDANRVFKIINKNSKLEKMPEGVSISQVNPVKDYFLKKYPKIFKSSLNPYRPNISETLFAEIIGTVVKNRPEITPDEIIEIIENFNKELSRKNEKYFKGKFDQIGKVRAFLDKAKISKFYIGALGNNWPTEVLSLFQLEETQKFERKKFNLKMRIAVWNKYIGKNMSESECFFCEEMIRVENFEIGHDLALAKSGSNDIENLFPLCGACNKIMGTDDFETKYKDWRDR